MTCELDYLTVCLSFKVFPYLKSIRLRTGVAYWEHQCTVRPRVGAHVLVTAHERER